MAVASVVNPSRELGQKGAAMYNREMAAVPADHTTDVGLTWRKLSDGLNHIVTATWRRMVFKVEERMVSGANRLYVTRDGRPVRLPGWRESFVIGKENAEAAIRAHVAKRRAVELDARAAVAAAADKPAKKWRAARVTPLRLSITPDKDGFKINEFAPGDVVRWSRTDGRNTVEYIGQVWSEAGSDYNRNDRTDMTGYFVVVQSEGKRTLSRPRAVRMIFASTPGGTVGWFIGDAQVTSLGDAGHAQLDLLEEYTRAQSAPVEPVVETPAPVVAPAPVAQPVEEVRDRFERGAAVWVAPDAGTLNERYVGEVMGYTRNGCFRVREAGYGTSVDVPAERLSLATAEEAAADRARQQQERQERAAEQERRNAEARERAAAAEAEFAAKREARVPCPRCGVRLIGMAGAGMDKCGNGKCGYVIGSWTGLAWRDGFTFGLVDGCLSYVPKTAEELERDARLDAMGKTFRSARVWARKRTDKDSAKAFAKEYATGGGSLPVDESAWLRWCEENGKAPAAPAEKSAASAGLDRGTASARPVDAEEAARAARALCPACRCREMVVEDGRCQGCGHVPAPAAAPVEPVVEVTPETPRTSPELDRGTAGARLPELASTEYREVFTSADGRLRYTLPTLPDDYPHRENHEAYRAEMLSNVAAQEKGAPKWKPAKHTAPKVRLPKSPDAPQWQPEPFKIGDWVEWTEQDGQTYSACVWSQAPGANDWFLTNDRSAVTGEYWVLHRYKRTMRATEYTHTVNGCTARSLSGVAPAQLPFEDMAEVPGATVPPAPVSYAEWLPPKGSGLVMPEPAPVVEAVVEAAPADPRAAEDARLRRSPYLSGGIARVTLAQLAAEQEQRQGPRFEHRQRVTTRSGKPAEYRGLRGTDGFCWVLLDGDTYPVTARVDELTALVEPVVEAAPENLPTSGGLDRDTASARPVEPVVEAAPAGAEPTPAAVAEEEARLRRRAAYRIADEAGRAAWREAGEAIQARRRAERGPDPEFPGALIEGESVAPVNPGWAQEWWALLDGHGFVYEINKRNRWHVMAQVGGVILGTSVPVRLENLGHFDTVEEALAAARDHAQQRATEEAGTMLVERVRRLAAVPVQFSTVEAEAGPVALPRRVAPVVEAAPPVADRAPVGGAARPGPVRPSDGPSAARTGGAAPVLPEWVEALIEAAVERIVEGVLARFGRGPGAAPAAGR
ncbi:hypothetical protein ACFWA9_38155 [Kitasatospora sp. NPDC059973]|uniref:hypothetical protein n=1 Tax=Kitasatospora sp. NPDC059973 TaxID=3347020 RepID=UPI0036748B58